MGYLDIDDAWLIALTRQRRAEARAAREANRALHEGLAFPVVPQTLQDQIEAAWRERQDIADRFRGYALTARWKAEQWELGVRNCGYCRIRMTRTPNSPRTCTVDHRKPRAYGGPDVPENFIMACLDCNSRKGTMSEAKFRQHLAVWKALGERLTA
jgi:5-methylcytosine-specific restriction endonuclease McrA